MPEISTHRISEHESVRLAITHAYSMELFRDSVIAPTLKTLDDQINEHRSSDDPAADFFAEDLAEIFQKSVEGYMLTIQSMWERGIRAMLISRESRLHQGALVEKIKNAKWHGSYNDAELTEPQKSHYIQSHFERLLGISPLEFDTYQDLDLLQNLGNAIRHGDGPASRRIFDISPSLWPIRTVPGTNYDLGNFSVTIPDDYSKYPPFDEITLFEVVLDQMVQSVIWFWEDIEGIRINSFSRKNDSISRSIDEWISKRTIRKDQRKWTAE